MFTSPSLAQRPSAVALDLLRRADSQSVLPEDAGSAPAAPVAPRGVSYRSRWRRGRKLVRSLHSCGGPVAMCPPRALPYALTRHAGAQLVACVVATLLLPLLQLALSLRGERGRDTPATRSAASREALPPWKGLPRYATVLPRRRPEPEPGCQGWRVGGGHAPSSEDDADLDAGPSPPLKMEDCYLPLDREPGLRGAARKPRPAPQRHKPKAQTAGDPAAVVLA